MKKWLSLLYFIFPSLGIGALFGLYPGYKIFEYTWKNSDFCLTCHVHDYATRSWETSIHGQHTTCHDCHHQPLRAYLKETWIMLTSRPRFPMDLHHTPYVKKDLCSACHLQKGFDRSTLTGPLSVEEIEKIPKIDDTHLHKIHLEKKTKFVLENHLEIPENLKTMSPVPSEHLNRQEGPEREITCADCHGGPNNRGHSFSAVDRTCVRCHGVKDGGGQQPHGGGGGQQGSQQSQQPHGGGGDGRGDGGGAMKVFGCRSCHFQEFLKSQ